MRSLAMLSVLLPGLALAAENRLVLADQSDFGNKRGFYLDLENSFADGQIGDLSTVRMILGVADGSNWRFLEYRPKARLGDTFLLEAHIEATEATLSVNGVRVAESSGAFARLGIDRLVASDYPSWAQSPIGYRPVQLSLAAKVGKGSARRWNLDDTNAGPLSLFETRASRTYSLPIGAGQTVDIGARVRFDAPLDLRQSAPFIDRFGQSVHAKWAGKVTGIADLRRAQEEEARLSKAWNRPLSWDAYGGSKNTGWTGTATGYYRTRKHGSVWWLESPQGNPLFYTGICTAPANVWDRTPTTGREYLWEALPPVAGGTAKLWEHNTWGSGTGDLYFAQHSWNLQRLFGNDFEASSNRQCVDRIHRWGFTGLGKWCDPMPGVPSMPVLAISGVDHPFRHYDVFDPTVKKGIEASLRSQIVPYLGSPWVLGWSIGNEYDEIVTRAEVVDVLSKPGSSPLRQALIGQAVKSLYAGDAKAQLRAWGMSDVTSAASVPDGDVEPLRQFYAKAYYGTLYSTIKRIDPNHLYFGFWIVPGWWQNDSDWDLIAPYCDVIGFDRYSESWAGIEHLLAKYDKPVLLGEFSFPAWYEGKRGYGRYSVFRSSDAQSGASYAALVDDASRDPHCVGTMWFQYRDQPLTGRGPGRGSSLVIGEHYAFGFVDITDRPKWELVKSARAANLRATKNRLALSR